MGDSQHDFLDESFETFQQTINVDLLGPMLAAKFAGRYMREHGGGCLLTTASTSALYGGYGVIPYRAAKAGVIGMTKSLAIELGKFNIRVNCISPGPTRTPIFADMASAFPAEKVELLESKAAEAMMGRMPLPRMGLPADIANAAVFLASDQAAQITGVDLPVDGGETAGNLDNTREKIQIALAKILEDV